MKVLAISDAHANIWALRAVIDAEKGYDLLVFAGDMVDYGTAPSQVINWFRGAQDAFIVQGNHDLNAVREAERTAPAEVPDGQYKWVHHNLERMGREELAYLAGLPKNAHFHADGWTYLLQHQYAEGSYDVIENRSQFLAFWRENMPKPYWDAPKKRILFGHSHRQCIHILGGQMEWANPGSISYRRPDDPEKTAQYMVITDGRIALKEAAYDRSPLYLEALRQKEKGRMMPTEIQDFMFFFGNAKSTREPL